MKVVYTERLYIYIYICIYDNNEKYTDKEFNSTKMESNRRNNSNTNNPLIENSGNLTINRDIRQDTNFHKNRQNDKQ